MMQALAAFLARVFIRITGLHIMTLEARKLAAAQTASRSVVQAIGTVDDGGGDYEGDVIELLDHLDLPLRPRPSASQASVLTKGWANL